MKRKKSYYIIIPGWKKIVMILARIYKNNYIITKDFKDNKNITKKNV